MSRRAITAALLLALVAGGAALVVALRRGSHEASGARPLLAFDPASIARIETADESRAERPLRAHAHQDAEGAWLVSVAPESSATEAAAWPASGPGVLAALRLLAEATTGARASRAPSEHATAGAWPRSLALTDRDGARAEVRFAPGGLAGLTRAASDGREAGVDSAAADAFFLPGLPTLRDRSAMPGAGADASRIRLRWDASEVALARTGARWVVTEPAPTRADPERVATLIAALASLVVDRFADELAPSQRPDAQARADLRIEIETDRRTPASGEPGHATRTTFRSLTLLAGARDAPRLAHALARLAPDALPMLMLLNAEGLLALADSPAAYASTLATGVHEADIGAVRIARPGLPPRTLTRTLDGWLADGVPDDETDAMAAEALAFLCAARASRVEFVPSGGALTGAFAHAAAVTLLGFADDALGSVEIGTIAEDGSRMPATIERDGEGPGTLRVFEGVTMPRAFGATP